LLQGKILVISDVQTFTLADDVLGIWKTLLLGSTPRISSVTFSNIGTNWMILICYDVYSLHTGYDVGVDINGSSNWLLQVHLKMSGEVFPSIHEDTHITGNVTERNILFSFEIKITKVQCLE